MNCFKHFPLRKTAACYLLLLGGFFFASYGLANHITAGLSLVPSVALPWEKHIPFLAWTTIPYWSIDFLYCISFFICTSKRELNVHALRLLTASVVCCICFILFPLACSAEIPHISNPFFRWLIFGSKLVATPFNQAPSQHIVLAWLVWLRFRAHTKGLPRALLSCWFILIGLSVLTTYQHHFIDVPLGLFAGLLISYFLPIEKYPRQKFSYSGKRIKIGAFYVAGSVLCFTAAFVMPFIPASLFFWTGSALLTVSVGYLAIGPAVFQKNKEGYQTVSAAVLLAPYTLGARLSRLYFMRGVRPADRLTPTLFIGALPAGKDTPDYLLDMTAEFAVSRWKNKTLVCCPQLDLLPLTPAAIQTALDTFRTFPADKPVLVFCSLGIGRSAAVCAAKLLETNTVQTVEEAVSYIKKYRPAVLISPTQIESLQQWNLFYRMNKSSAQGENMKQMENKVIENVVAGQVVKAFLSVTPQLLIVSLVAYATAICGFNFFFNPNVIIDIIGAAILGMGSLIGLWTMFLSVHLFVEGKLFEVLYNNPKETKAFDDAIQFFWKVHRKDRSLQSRWEGTRTIYFKAVTLCITQWALTLIGFALVAAGIQY